MDFAAMNVGAEVAVPSSTKINLTPSLFSLPLTSKHDLPLSSITITARDLCHTVDAARGFSRSIIGCRFDFPGRVERDLRGCISEQVA